MQWFDQEKERARREGVTDSQNYPFLFHPERPGDRAVILVHGFGSSPREMAPLAEKLQQHDLTVYGVRLPGHGTCPEDLAGQHAADWYASVEQGYINLSATHTKISVAGLSTGALLAIELALKWPIEKLLLLSPFLKLQHPLAPFAGLLRYIIPYQKVDISELERSFYYQRRPLTGIAQINRIRRHIRSQLHKITAPTLVLASQGDATIAQGTAKELFTRLGSSTKQFHSYGPDVPHVLTSQDNPEQQDVLRRCLNFLL